MLASFLIKQLQESIVKPRTAVCYYYCYFGHRQDENTPFLRWILSQLCRRAKRIPANICQVRQDGCRPSDDQLLLDLENILESFDVAYIVIDAVDESEEREHLIASLATLAHDARFRKIQLLVTSREYSDIRQGLNPTDSNISMDHQEVEKDIRKYVHTELKAKPNYFKYWSQALRDHVEITLAHEAKGMYVTNFLLDLARF